MNGWRKLKCYINVQFKVMEKAITHTNISLPTGADMQNQLLFLLQLSDALRPLSNPMDIEEAATKIALEFMEVDRCHYGTIEGDSVIVFRSLGPIVIG